MRGREAERRKEVELTFVFLSSKKSTTFNVFSMSGIFSSRPFFL